jgi:hypothetical protein
MHDFWVPQYKWQYIEWLDRHYPNNRKGERINWNKFSLEKLRIIYINYRSKKRHLKKQLEFNF